MVQRDGGVLEAEIEGEVLAHGVVDIELTLASELHHGEGGEGLGAGADAVEGVGRRWKVVGDVPRPESLGVDDLAFLDEG